MLEAGQCPLGNRGHTTPHRRCMAPDMTHRINETIFWFISGSLLLDCSLKERLSFCFHSFKIKQGYFKITWFVLLPPHLSDGILVFSLFFTTQYVIIKKSLTTKRASKMKMAFEPIFYCRFNSAAWHLLVKSWFDIIFCDYYYFEQLVSVLSDPFLCVFSGDVFLCTAVSWSSVWLFHSEF